MEDTVGSIRQGHNHELTLQFLLDKEMGTWEPPVVLKETLPVIHTVVDPQYITLHFHYISVSNVKKKKKKFLKSTCKYIVCSKVLRSDGIFVTNKPKRAAWLCSG